ncbi:hypothetical protein H310_01547 [Aphanomyces invadans]|uniref:Conserved oligomeric Golgi complex subunit 5 n=1 Tax=Aphanomyces invadans TaxID=157072 RepID=A0A024US02_9STRA|nr:hypothetical protein H310_01547 [Aphanomyces invadans]ETW09089.1 hypothetical protein H310_01547 [Aphanomyces invadans]|eukprot:XP_008862894.1 hypothetical protein H310_01547 [Aphanomyces invadans]
MDEVVSMLRADDQLRVFLKPDGVDIAAIASDIIAQDSTNSTTTSASEDFSHKLTVAMKRIDESIEGYINVSHTDLLGQVGSVDGLKAKVTRLHTDVHDVQAAIQRMDSDIHKAHQRLQRTVYQLRNVDLCSSVLQRVLRFQALLAKLQQVQLPPLPTSASSINSANIYSTASLALREAELLIADEHDAFQSLAVVAPGLPLLRTWRTDLTKHMKALLRLGMTGMDQVAIGSALQILFQLGPMTLSEHVQGAVNAVLEEVEAKCTQSLQEASFDESKLKADVWAALQTVLNTLSAYAMQVWNLQRVLIKSSTATTAAPSSRSPATPSTTYLSLVLAPDEPTLFATFWDISCALVRDLLSQTLEYKASVAAVIVGYYPKLRVEAQEVVTTLHTTSARLSLDSLIVCGTLAERDQLVATALAPLLEAYQKRSFQRMASPIQLMFPQSSNYHASPPSRSDMTTLLKIMAQELDVAGSDDAFRSAILVGVKQSVDLFCRSVRGMAHPSLPLPPTAKRTPAQAHNVGLVGVCVQLEEALHEWPELDAARESIQALALRLLGQYLTELAVKLEAVLAKMHHETYADSMAAAPPASAMVSSRFMVEFASVFHVVETEHLARLGLDPDVLCRRTCLSEFSTRLLSHATRQLALVRPLGEVGKCRLASDMAQFEMVLANSLELSGLALEEFKAFRHLLFVDTANVTRDGRLDKVRPSNVCHHLLSRGPAGLQAPWQAKGWTIPAYVAWMETQAGLTQYSPVVLPSDMPLGVACWKDRALAMAAEDSIWKEILACLDSYAQRSSARGNRDVDSIYEVLMDAGPSLLAGYEVATKAYLYPPTARVE